MNLKRPFHQYSDSIDSVVLLSQWLWWYSASIDSCSSQSLESMELLHLIIHEKWIHLFITFFICGEKFILRSHEMWRQYVGLISIFLIQREAENFLLSYFKSEEDECETYDLDIIVVNDDGLSWSRKFGPINQNQFMPDISCNLALSNHVKSSHIKSHNVNQSQQSHHITSQHVNQSHHIIPRESVTSITVL